MKTQIFPVEHYLFADKSRGVAFGFVICGRIGKSFDTHRHPLPWFQPDPVEPPLFVGPELIPRAFLQLPLRSAFRRSLFCLYSSRVSIRFHMPPRCVALHRDAFEACFIAISSRLISLAFLGMCSYWDVIKGFLQRLEHSTFCDSGRIRSRSRVKTVGVFPALEEVRGTLVAVAMVKAQAAAADPRHIPDSQ